ncbi:MAG: InlB B-repeat-containing protein [Clostridia bacterium]|nr:InlB B-repeat-containing protein [Clostridia bacterium]
MKRKTWKIGLTLVFITVALCILAIPTFAIHTNTGHFDPDGGLAGFYAYSSSECNRKINVYFYDTSGTLLKTVAIHTKTGEENTFKIGLGGYDIVKFESNKGIWQNCEMAWTSSSGTGMEAQLYVNYLFRNLSKNELDITVTMRKWDPIQFEVRHYVELSPTGSGRNNYGYHSTTISTTKDYYASFSTAQRSITGYTLASGYNGSLSGNLCFEALLGNYANIPDYPRSYSYDYVNTSYADAMKSVTKYDESKDGKLSYCTNRVFWVEYFYDIKEYTVSYNANGGSGAPASQTKYHGYDMALSDTVPTRSGYTFKGWATSSTATTASYQPGGNYTANATRTLYAVWESNAPKTYTVTYNANGGTGAPASQTKTHDVPLTLRSEIPTRAGYTFKGWSTSSASTVGRYGAGGTYTTNASVTLYAAWQPTYTVSYDANGGTGAPASQTKLNNTTLYLSTTIPTRFNYAFLGWSTSSTATTATYAAGGSFTTNANTKLYAVWQYDPVKYTISYDANGGSGAPSSQTKTYDVALTLSTTVPTRTGYTFKGWATSASATSATYSAGGSYTANSGATLYAVWQINTYTVSYNANGGSGAPSAQTKTYGVNLTLSSTKPTRTGYTFQGWATSASATSASYSAGSSYTSNSSTTLYAVWQINTYTVSYNANGGSGAPSAQTKTYGTALTLSSTKPTRTGYTFQGWATSSSATSASYSAGGSYTSNSGATLYAVWKINTYTVSYNANGGSGAPSAQTKTYGTALTLSSTKPTRTGYSFQGWATSASATSASYSAGGSYTTNSAVTLYAVWKANIYTISYNANGGTGAPSAQTKTYGVNLTLSSTKPTRAGYSFLGWATSASATSASYNAGGTYTSNGGTTLYAVWKPDTYTVTFKANGGNGVPSAQTKVHDVTLPLSTTVPTRTGYSFLGWSTSSSATSATYTAGGSYTANSAVTLYAVWKANTYTVSFHANGGTGAPSAQTKTYGVNLTLPSVIPIRTGYSFLGWATSTSATSATYNAGGAYTSNSGATLYAVWKANTYTVSFNANGGSGAPSSLTKTHGINLTLPTTVPTRSRYNFLGWSTDPTATSATYTAGGSYPTNSAATLYAVWEKANYEFSVSITSVSNPSPYRYGEITVKVRADNWDNVNAYSNIPVQLYYDGQLMSTQNVNFAAYGVANLTFTLYVGDTPGNRTLEARINWSDRGSETDPSNNSASTAITVKELDYAMSIESVTVSDRYHAGETVITSFMVSNDSRYDITPDKNNTAIFTAYYYNGSNRVVITTATWNNVVIPGDKSNIVYFKWTVPSGMTGQTVYCECTINADSAVNEEDMENNTAVLTMTIASLTDSQTPNTRFENTKPGSYKGYGAPAEETEKATWTMWVYENNQFVLKSYGVQISSADPVITPGADCKTAVYENGKWTIRSGYGFTLSYTPTVITTSGYNTPDSSAYTNVQYVIAEFPEFNYADSNGNCRTLVYVDGKWQFVKNASAADNERVHFIPVWFVDGDYTVSVTASRVWTPAGVISATRTSNSFAVEGSIYDDYFVGN